MNARTPRQQVAVNLRSSDWKSWSWGTPALVWMPFFLVRARRLSVLFPEQWHSVACQPWSESIKDRLVIFFSEVSKPFTSPLTPLDQSHVGDQQTECNNYTWYLLTIYYEPDPRCDSIMHIRWFNFFNNPFDLLAAILRPLESPYRLGNCKWGDRDSPELGFNTKLLFLVPPCIPFHAVHYLSRWSILALNPYFGVFYDTILSELYFLV